MRTRNDTGGTGSHFAPLRFMFAGVAIAAALLAVVFAGCALAGASSLQGVDGLERQVQITAYVTLVVVALFAGGAAWQWRWYRNALAGSGTLTGATAITGEIAAWTAAAGTAVTWWLAHRASRHVAVLELVDLDSAVLLSILGASCAIVAVGCRGAAALGWRQAVSSTGADRPESRRTLLRSAVATLLVGALVGVLLVLAQRPALDLGGTTAAPTQVRPWPTDVGETAYRIKIDGASPVVRAAGPGFVVAAGDQLTAYDGATGAPRWHFGLTALGEPLTHDGYRELAVYRSGPDDTVVVTGELLTVGLDAMTGRLLWRTPTATYAGVGDDGPHRVRIIEDAGGDGIHELTVTEPRTGTVRWRSETRCASAVGADATWLVRSVCDDSGTVEVVDLENRRGRQVTVTAPEHGEPDYVWSFGDNLFAVVYGVPELGDPVRVSVVDAAQARGIDHFETVLNQFTWAENGRIAWSTNPGSTKIDPQVMIRDVHAQTTTTVTVPESSSGSYSFDAVWLDDLLVVGAVDGGVIRIDAERGTAGAPQAVCLPGQSFDGRASVAVRDIRSVSGALLVTCEPFRLDDSRVPYSAEIVGLR